MNTTNDTPNDSNDVEVRTQSVPVAGHLVCLGFVPLGVSINGNVKTIRFAADARPAVEAFMLAKQRIDALIDAAPERSGR
jgi:hypothetical protein